MCLMRNPSNQKRYIIISIREFENFFDIISHMNHRRVNEGLRAGKLT
jgi:hypothetical protein